MAGISSLTALEGVWTLTRRIAHSDGSTHHFDGTARFTRSGKRLIHFEEGLLTGVPGQAAMRGTRRYVWSMEPGRIEVMFDDMRPFHTIPVATPRPETINGTRTPPSNKLRLRPRRPPVSPML